MVVVLGEMTMKFSRRSAILLSSGTFSFILFSRAAFAETVVAVALWDKGEASMDGMDTMKPMGMGMPGAMMDMATMGITVDAVEIPAGEVTFAVVNESQDFYHSVTISSVEDPSRELPYLIDKMMVDEEAAGITARLKELKPRAFGKVTVDMQPGTYILYCNIAGHYVMGMWTIVTVV
jgi:uncharacterized cupredoxin-like copper-binding protein